MAKLYVGCSLTHAPREFVDKVNLLKEQLRGQGHEVADFLGLTAGTPTDVYETDIKECVAECEILIAICDFPSIGLGWEMATAVEKHRKPTLAVASYHAHVSRLLLGVEGEHNPRYAFRRYGDLSQVPSILSAFLKGIEDLPE